MLAHRRCVVQSIGNRGPAPVPGTTRPHAPPPQPQPDTAVCTAVVVHFRPGPRRLIICMSNRPGTININNSIYFVHRGSRSTLLLFAVLFSTELELSYCCRSVDLISEWYALCYIRKTLGRRGPTQHAVLLLLIRTWYQYQ